MNIIDLSTRLRILKYRSLDLITSKNTIRRNTKLASLYSRLGDYKNSVKHAEAVYKSGSRADYYYILKNLHILSNATRPVDIADDPTAIPDDIVSLIGALDSNICDFDKIKFIQDYVLSKGAIPCLIGISGKGKRLKNKTIEEKELISNPDLYTKGRYKWGESDRVPSYIKYVYRNYNDIEISDLFNSFSPVVKSTKVVLRDFENPCVSVQGGSRVTTSQPRSFNRRVLVFGTSTTFSIGSRDEDSITSIIQRELNKSYSDIKVENYGVQGMRLILAINNLVQTDIKENDIVVFFDYDEFNRAKNEYIFNIDLNKLDRGRDFFIDLTKHQCHFSPSGNSILAKSIVNEIIPSMINRDVANYREPCDKMLQVLDNLKYCLYRHTAQSLESCEMKSYLSLLEKHVPKEGTKVGSVAVNCNPITLGHLHLLEYAAGDVDELFVFVIEEDKSFFKFEDRLKLVCEATNHLENVTVLRGGRFICTELTYPDYFEKDTKEAKADASMEAWFFCEYIAKKLNIGKIFLGDEPNCMITKQYNDKMQELLPGYGIEVEIIDRISTGGQVISASKVRAYLKEQDFQSIKPIVPEATYRFLKANF